MVMDAVNPKIATLASLMQAKKKAGKPFVVMLGAGASISSGVTATDKLMQEIVDLYGRDIRGTDLRDRFDELWTRSTEENRRIFLKGYLDRQPSPGYAHLVDLMNQGFVDTVITFNYDNLLEAALMNGNLRESFDYKVIVRGDYKDDRVITMMSATEPRLKILKLHGSLRGGDTFLFSLNEMSGYPDEIHELVQQLTSRDIVVCGYGFKDTCVVRAFSNKGEGIYCADRYGAPPFLKGFLVRRGSENNVVDGEDGSFDAFFESLRASLTKKPSSPPHRPAHNPFKFLDGYEPADKEWLFGRRALTRKVLAQLPKPPTPGSTPVCAPLVPIIGPAKAGKTSFVRAGLLPYLDPAAYLPVYTRCRRDLEQSLPETLKERFNIPVVPGDIPATLRSFAAAKPDRHIVLVLDQFERVVAKYLLDQRELTCCVQGFRDLACQNLTVIPVSEPDKTGRYFTCLNDLGIKFIDVPFLEARKVGRIVEVLAKHAGARFDPRVIEALRTKYQDSMIPEHEKTPFTLAHVQAICNLLIEGAIAGQSELDELALTQVMQEHLVSLNRAINEYDILSFVEDFPLEEQRALLCRILRIVAEPGRSRIADYVRANLSDLLKLRSALKSRNRNRSGSHAAS